MKVEINFRALVELPCCTYSLGPLLAVLLSGTPLAHAYSDPESYDLPVLQGGSGGRWFTGSPADGYGCKVCHDGTTSLSISLTGLPWDSGYVAGQAYELTVGWPLELEHMALVLEIGDEAGARAGSLQPPRPEALRPEEACSKEGSEGMPASGVVESPNGREFAVVIDCGAHAMRVLWTAPSSPSGTLWLSGGLVAADGEANASGDATVMIRRPLAPVGALVPVMQLTEHTGCSALPGSTTTRSGWLVSLILAGLGCVRGRRVRNRGGDR